MKRSSLVRLTGACLAMLLTAAPLRADPITWSEGSFATPATVYADNTTTSGIKLDGSHHFNDTLYGSNRIVLANLSTFSNAGMAAATFTQHQPFSLILVIKDKASGLASAINFTGYFKGTVSQGNANLKIDWTSPLTQSVDINHHVYEVTIDPTKDFHLSADGVNGYIDATVKVSHNPEPSSFLLAALALPVVGWAARRKRRAAKAQEAEDAPLAT